MGKNNMLLLLIAPTITLGYVYLFKLLLAGILAFWIIRVVVLLYREILKKRNET